MRSIIVKNELVVGTFVALALMVAIVYATKQSRERGLLDVHRIRVEVPHGAGLEPGAPVVMRGIEVGEIEDVELTGDHRVRVTCSITPRFKKFIPKDTRAAIIEPPLLGTTKVELAPGIAREPAEDEQILQAYEKPGLLAKVEDIEAKVNGVVAKIDSFVATANNITRAVENQEGLVGRLIYDKQLADDATAMIGDLQEITEKARAGKSALGIAVSDEQFGKDLQSMATDVRTILDSIERGEGSLGRLYKDSRLVEETEGLITDTRGSLERLNRVLVRTEHAMVKVDELMDNTGGITSELNKTLKKINDGDGTVAALLNDDALYRETKSLLKELRESVEDLREQAPINSFIGVVFSAF